jgi:hypothetical protein
VRLTHEVGLTYRWRFDSPGREGAQTDLLDNARALRERLRSDPDVPAVVRRLLPVMAATQWLLIEVVRPVVQRVRRGG